MRERYLLSSIKMPLVFVVTGRLCHLDFKCMMIVMIFSLFSVCIVSLIVKKSDERAKLNEQAYFYMEQMIYCFGHHRKILASLKDISKMTDGVINNCINDSIMCIENDIMHSNVFDLAFEKIESIFGCEIMYNQHYFYKRVEEEGGDCSLGLKLLLKQLKMWKNRNRIFKNKKENLRRKLSLTLILSCILCISIIKLEPAGISITDGKLYQITNCTGIILFEIIYIFFYWIIERKSIDDDIKEKFTSKKIENLYKKLNDNINIFNRRYAVRKLENLIRFEFPVWMFDMLLRLQHENVQTAITNSLYQAPAALTYPLYELENNIKNDPVGIEPYQNFLKEFNLPEIKAVMLQIFAIQDMGREEINEQIYTMLDQNMNMIESTDELKMDSILMGMGMFAALPMIISVMIMLIDMSNILFQFLKEIHI